MNWQVSGLLGRYGDSWWMTTCCDGYYTNVAAAPARPRAPHRQDQTRGADAPPSAYDMIRKGGFRGRERTRTQLLFRYMAVDAVVRAMAGQEPGALRAARVPDREGQR